MSDDLRNRFRGCLLGLAVGDAVGTTVEFCHRGSFEPINEMVGGGPFRLKPGQWTDDTSMALCLAESLIEKHGFDPQDQIERYVRWYREGHLSSTGTCFDIGNATSTALHRFEATGDPFSGSTNPRTAGNGSIMRLAPIPMWFFPNLDETIHFGGESSRTTHAADECIAACRLFAYLIGKALGGQSKERILFGPDNATRLELPEKVESIARGLYGDKSEDEIKGSGYVIESLEAALWCFIKTDHFKEAILKAANLGDDADTTAAVCGQIAGAYYGESGIPAEWLKQLAMVDLIRSMSDKLCSVSYSAPE